MIENYKLLEILLTVTWLTFAFAFGACVGSLINVLAYRLPLGLDVVSPASRCPKCSTLLTWRENIPVFGWLLLRGKCRFCRSPISSEYPIVEAFMGLIFAGLYYLWFVAPGHGLMAAGDTVWADVAPEFARNGFGAVWPTYVLMVVLLGSLTAMTLIDARTFQIPLVLTWVPMMVGVVAHTLHAAWIGREGETLRATAEGHFWVLPTSDPRAWELMGATFGAAAGLWVSAGLQRLGVLKQSYADYAEWEASLELPEAPPADSEEKRSGNPGRVRRAVFLTAIAALATGVLGHFVFGVGLLAAVGAGLVSLPIYAKLTAPQTPAQPATSDAELWIRYPHARREALRELVWLAPAAALALVGLWLGGQVNPGVSAAADAPGPWLDAGPPMPLWLHVLSASLLGLLVGGGLIWGIRILGSLAFGKEAMGMGDVWLMAAVGACLGWMDATLVFFIAPFFALYITLVLWAWDGAAKRAMPYGPALAAATFFLIFAEPLVEWSLGQIWRLEGPVVLP